MAAESDEAVEPEWVTVREAARRLAMSPSWFKTFAKEAGLELHRRGQWPGVNWCDVEAAIARSRIDRPNLRRSSSSYPPARLGLVDTPSVLEFSHEGRSLAFPVEEVGREPSPFTGRPLRKLQSQLTLSASDAATVRQLFQTQLLVAVDGSAWKATIATESYTNDGPHTLRLAWDETELLNATSVDFEGLSLVPSEYQENVDDDGSVVIVIRCTLTTEETARLRALRSSSPPVPRYFPVVRHGVSKDPRQMRLGRVLWQQVDDGHVAHEVALVDEAFDSFPHRMAVLGGEPVLGNLVEEMSALMAQFETVLSELQAAGVLSSDAAERVRSSGPALGPANRYRFYEVEDLSKW